MDVLSTTRLTASWEHENGDGDAIIEQKDWGENAVLARNYKH